MEIIVSGTIGGYKKLYPASVASYESNRVVFGISDPRPTSNNVHAIGSYAYSLKLLNGDIMMSKYIIARDTIGGSRTGNIVFSVIISSVELISGKNAKSLLDDLHNEFCRLGYLDENNNLYEGNINWSFIDRVKNNYNIEKRIRKEALSSNGKEEAFAYYRNDDELCRFFDWPYQKKYEQFMQVYLVSEEYRDNEKNPLGALKHSDKDDLTCLRDNLECYKLSFNDRIDGIDVEIYVKGERCGNGTKVNKNDSIKIKYSKNNYEPKYVEDSITSLESDGYVIIGNDTVSVLRPSIIDLQPTEKRVRFKVVDEDGRETTANIHINDDNIGCNPEWVFKGDDIDKTFEVWAEDADNKSVHSETIKLCPKKIVDEQKIVLKEHKKIKIHLVDESTGKSIENFSIEEIKTDNYYKVDESRISNDSVEFVGKSQIRATWWLKIKGYNDVRLSPSSYSNNEATIKVEKKSEYANTESQNQNNPHNHPDGQNHQNHQNGQNHQNRNCDGNSKNRIHWKTLIIVSGALLVVALIVIWLLIGSSKMEKIFDGINDSDITLSKMKELYTKYECENCRNGNKSFVWPTKKKKNEFCEKLEKNVRFLDSLDAGCVNNIKDSDSISLNSNLEDIKETIIRKNTINQGVNKNIMDSLAKYLKKESISEISVKDLNVNIERFLQIADEYNKSPKADACGSSGDISCLNDKINELDDITGKIDSIKFDESFKEFTKYKTSVTGKLKERKDAINNKIKELEKTEKERIKNAEKEEKERKKKKDAMLAYIKGGELEVKKLEKYKNNFKNYEKSIDLCIEFWNIIEKVKEKQNYDGDLKTLRDKVADDTNLKNDSELKKFLEKFKNEEYKVTNKLNAIKSEDWNNIKTLDALNTRLN